jgi:hypothetical protein
MFSEGISENKGDCHQCRILSFLNMSTLKNSFGGSVDNYVANKTYHIKKHDNCQNFSKKFVNKFTDYKISEEF